MNKLKRSAHDMFDLMDDAESNGDLAAGNLDAVGHFGQMLQQGVTPEVMSDIHDATIFHEDTTELYRTGYSHMWNTLYDTLYDSLDHKP